MPELEENSYYVKKSLELKPVLNGNGDETIKVQKGSIVKMEMSGDKMIFENVNLLFEDEKIVGLVGESGSGKSTLMKMVMK